MKSVKKAQSIDRKCDNKRHSEGICEWTKGPWPKCESEELTVEEKCQLEQMRTIRTKETDYRCGQIEPDH